MNSIFKQLLNVKGMIVEDARIVDSPLRPEPVLEIRVRPRRGMLRCSRCGRRRHGYDRGGGVRRWRHQDFGCWRVELVAAMPSPFDGLAVIGVDETGCRKGHTYLTVVVDHERHRVIWAHDGVGRDVFDLFFKALTHEQRASIRIVTGGGARWIDSCVAEHCPNAERVPDGFRIVSWMTGVLDKVRKRLWNQARRDGDENAAKRMRGVKYAVLKNPGDLTDRQFATLGTIRNTDPKGQLYRAWQLKELLRALLKHPIEQARGELNHWVFWASHSRIPEIVELAKKIRRRRSDILCTIQLEYSNARLEAFNNRIKVTIRMAYGSHHVNNLIALVMLRCGGLDMRLPQPRT